MKEVLNQIPIERMNQLKEEPNGENESTEIGTEQNPNRERNKSHGKEIPLALQFLIEEEGTC